MTPKRIPYVEIAAELAERKAEGQEPVSFQAYIENTVSEFEEASHAFIKPLMRPLALALERELAATWRPDPNKAVNNG